MELADAVNKNKFDCEVLVYVHIFLQNGFSRYVLDIRYLLRFFDCLAHPNLSAPFATDEK